MLDHSGAEVHAVSGLASVRLITSINVSDTPVLSGATSLPLALGAAAFTNLSVETAGNYTLIFTVPNGSSVLEASLQLDVIPGIPEMLTVHDYPSSVRAGAVISSGNAPPRVAVTDALGNVILDATNARVTVTSNCTDPPPLVEPPHLNPTPSFFFITLKPRVE